MDSSKKGGGILMLVVVLGLITFVCALLLGFTNGVTKDKICLLYTSGAARCRFCRRAR